MWPKRGRKGILRCFWPFWKLKTSQNFLTICGNSYFCMTNPEMLSFPPKEVPRKSECQVAWRTRQKNLCFAPKIQNWQKVCQISWNLGWVSCIKWFVVLRKPQPKSWACLALCSSSKFSSTWPSKSLFLVCKLCFMPNSDRPCASTPFSIF